jgi:hypothetical protein
MVNSQADCLIAFSFGFREQRGARASGISNEDLARFVEQQNVPWIMQAEVAAAVGEPTRPSFKISRHRTPGEYLDTREVADQARSIMREHGWRCALLVAHPAHMPRVEAVCRRLGIEPVLPSRLKVRFDQGSAQEWTRSEEAWRKREADAVRYYRSRGWM